MRLSILIPTYNRAGFLNECLQSILKIELPDLQVVVVDDNSTDRTAKVVEDFKSHENVSIVYIKNQETRGAQFSRNLCLSKSDGELVMFLDSDDILVSKGVMQVYYTMKRNKQLQFVHGVVEIVDDQLRSFEPRKLSGFAYQGTAREIPGYHWHTMGAMYRRTFLDLVGDWDERLSSSQDWEFQTRVKMNATNYTFIDTIIGKWRQHTFEKIGAHSFSRRYTRTVGKAIRIVISNTGPHESDNLQVYRKLFNKALIHGMQANVFVDKKSTKYFTGIMEVLSTDQLAPRFAYYAFRLTPRFLHYIILRIIAPEMLN